MIGHKIWHANLNLPLQKGFIENSVKFKLCRPVNAEKKQPNSAGASLFRSDVGSDITLSSHCTTNCKYTEIKYPQSRFECWYGYSSCYAEISWVEIAILCSVLLIDGQFPIFHSYVIYRNQLDVACL